MVIATYQLFLCKLFCYVMYRWEIVPSGRQSVFAWVLCINKGIKCSTLLL